MSFAKECGLEYDENENKENENNNQMLYNFSYSSSKRKSLFSENTQRPGETNLFCNIFQLLNKIYFLFNFFNY